jgi:hypothetical protein
MTNLYSVEVGWRDGVESCVVYFPAITTADPLYKLHIVSPRYGHLLASSYNVFDALFRLRVVLEILGGRIRCHGARVEAWATQFARDMGGGTRVYITQLGQHIRSSELVPTLAPTQVASIGSIAEQMAFHHRWLESIREIISMSDPTKPIPREVMGEAKLHPRGYVYKIDGGLGPNDEIPPEAIMGAWNVDEKMEVLLVTLSPIQTTNRNCVTR